MNFLKNKILLAILAIVAAIFAFFVTTHQSEKAEQARQEQEFKKFGGGTVPSIKGAIDKETKEANKRAQENK